MSAPPNAVIPVSGSKYNLQNLGYGHFLDNSGSVTADGNPILGWSKNTPATNNQLWIFLTYPSSNNEIVFTLQSVSTTNSETAFDGRGGYVRVDSTNNKLVQGGAPMAWKLLKIYARCGRR